MSCFDAIITGKDKIEDYIERGKLYKKVQDKEINDNKKRVTVRQFLGFKTVCINYNGNPSEMAETMLREHPDCVIALVWRWNGDSRLTKVSLRKRVGDGGPKLGALVKTYYNWCKGAEAGGHDDAAGFTLPSSFGIEGMFESHEWMTQ
jgi:hypothetical protein